MNKPFGLFFGVTITLLALTKWAEALLSKYIAKVLIQFMPIVDHQSEEYLRITLVSMFVLYLLCGFISFLFYRGERMFHWIIGVGLLAAIINITVTFVMLFLFSRQPVQADFIIAGLSCVGIWVGGRIALLVLVVFRIKYDIEA